MTFSMIKELYAHNDWANAKILDLCENLTDAQWDEERPQGMGTLRKTLFHIFEAERLWIERWTAAPWRAITWDPGPMKLQDLRQLAAKNATHRNQLLAEEERTDFSRIVSFRNTLGKPFERRIDDLFIHVANHGIYHRGQILTYLKSFGRTIPGGIDYLFWKLAFPSCEQSDESVVAARQFGLEVAAGQGTAPRFERDRLQKYFGATDWAVNQVFDCCQSLDAAQLDFEFNMGMGSIRKNLQHVLDAERWWLANWKTPRSPFPRDETPRSLAELRELHQAVAVERMTFLGEQNDESATRVVEVRASGPILRFRVGESLIQLCGHHTHHRAQTINMLRRSGVTTPETDYLYFKP
ncbi:MAG: DinB family protein [Pirellulaceae bacterium]